MRYLHVRPTHSYIGLPVGDLESGSLTPDQLILLDQAIKAGVYAPETVKQADVSREPKPKSKAKPIQEREVDYGTINQTESDRADA
jgi:hypothetical protein